MSWRAMTSLAVGSWPSPPTTLVFTFDEVREIGEVIKEIRKLRPLPTNYHRFRTDL